MDVCGQKYDSESHIQPEVNGPTESKFFVCIFLSLFLATIYSDFSNPKKKIVEKCIQLLETRT